MAQIQGFNADVNVIKYVKILIEFDKTSEVEIKRTVCVMSRMKEGI